MLSAVTSHGVVPYVTAGVGGLTVFGREELGINDAQTFLTRNVGGGIKWYVANGRWGLRAYCRFEAVRSKNDAPVFCGRDTWYRHRVYAGFVITTLR